jgi:pimeloyl-ACP methyl ester carboxylesterase
MTEVYKVPNLMTRYLLSVAALLILTLAGKPADCQTYEGEKKSWCGFDRYDFAFEGMPAIVVVPKQAAKGKPWLWNAMFFGHKTNVDSTLLARGLHVVYLGAVDRFGSPEAVAIWNRFYAHLTSKYGLGNKVALEGISRGGLYAYNWAAANPTRVTCIYADAPVCDFKSWPGGFGTGKGDSVQWQKCRKAYGFSTDLEAFNYRQNPVDNLAVLAKARIPLLHVTGDADDIVPMEENTSIIEKKYKDLGGSIRVIVKPGVDHKHGLADPSPITDFILKYNLPAK